MSATINATRDEHGVVRIPELRPGHWLVLLDGEPLAFVTVPEPPADDFPCCSPGSTAHAPREITHAVMCGVGSSGSCFVPWCTCECHLRSSDVALVR